MDGQMSIFDFPEYMPEDKTKAEPKKMICMHSGHECNKDELFKIAEEDNPFCPHVCCRFCQEKTCGVRCNGAAAAADTNKGECNLGPDAKDEDKAGNCFYCAWFNRLGNGLKKQQEGCFWQIEFPNHLDQEQLESHSCWLPNPKTMKVCASCKHTNPFCYDGEDMHNPVINNDLYCELSDFHNKTPINRRELFVEYRCKKEFGVGFYHRNHEYDTCDCWERKNS